MRAVVQRVSEARVEVGGMVVGSCRQGLLVLVAAHREDTPEHAAKLADRLKGLRVFSDSEGKMNLNLEQAGGSLLVVSNFTIYGDAMAGRRPSFTSAASYSEGERLYRALLDHLEALKVPFEAGIFGADMQVALVNDGPVALVIDV